MIDESLVAKGGSEVYSNRKFFPVGKEESELVRAIVDKYITAAGKGSPFSKTTVISCKIYVLNIDTEVCYAFRLKSRRSAQVPWREVELSDFYPDFLSCFLAAKDRAKEMVIEFYQQE